MGCKKGENIAMVLCLVGLAVMVHQGGVLSNNSHFFKSQEKELISIAVPSLATHFCDLTKQEINSFSSSPSSSPSSALPLSDSSLGTPILDLVGESLTASIPVVSSHLSENIIEDAVTHAGFFPSNLMDTLQDLLEYNSNVMANTVAELLLQISQSYYITTGKSLYIKEGNYAQELSQIFSVVASVPQLTQNTEIPEQDSWLGNFFVSLPNIAYETAVNETSWTNGLTSASQLFHHLSKNEWSGVYYSGNDPDNGRVDWSCGGCDNVFTAIHKQTRILANASQQQI